MSPEYKRSATLAAAGVYFILCAASAIFWPSLWFLCAGLEQRSFDIPLAVVGAMMLGLGSGVFLASTPSEERLLLKLLTIANGADALIVASYTAIGSIPFLNGAGLAAVDLLWVAVLMRAHRKTIANG